MLLLFCPSFPSMFPCVFFFFFWSFSWGVSFSANLYLWNCNFSYCLKTICNFLLFRKFDVLIFFFILAVLYSPVILAVGFWENSSDGKRYQVYWTRNQKINLYPRRRSLIFHLEVSLKYASYSKGSSFLNTRRNSASFLWTVRSSPT